MCRGTYASSRARVLPIIAIGLAFAVSSCSKQDSNPVSGKVLYKGEPIKGAVVTFHPKGVTDPAVHRPNGVTGDDGSFTLSTALGDGAPTGQYVVTINWPKTVEKSPGKAISTDGKPDSIDGLDGKYSDLNQSGIEADVKSGKNVLEPFKLD